MWFYIVDKTVHSAIQSESIYCNENSQYYKDRHHNFAYFLNTFFYTAQYNDSSDGDEQEKPAKWFESSADEACEVVIFCSRMYTAC